MPSKLVQFSWDVLEVEVEGENKGYQLYDNDGKRIGEPGVYLIESVPFPSPGIKVTRYNPLTEAPALYRNFAYLEPTGEQIVQFANEYGRLGGKDMEQELFLPSPKGSERAEMRIGEPIGKWKEEILWMRQLVYLSDMVKNSQVEELSKCFHVSKRVKCTDYYLEQVGDMGSFAQRVPRVPLTHIQAEFGKYYREGDIFQIAQYYIKLLPRERILNRVAPDLLWDKARTELDVYLVPASLIGAMWWQFIQSLKGNKSYRRCQWCNKWFEISIEASRPQKIYCSNACKFKAYRWRQAKAYELHSQGISLNKIAEIINTDSKTAAGWIEKQKVKGK